MWAMVCCMSMLRLCAGCADVLEARVLQRVGFPVAVVEVPPLVLENAETLGLHVPAQQFAQAAWFFGTAGVGRIRAFGHLVVQARHLDRPAVGKGIQSQVDRAA